MTIGVLGLQGDFREHLRILGQLGISGRDVRSPKALEGVKGLIIPGGESTTLARLLDNSGLFEPIRQRGRCGFPLFGTCAGMILLAKRASPALGRSLGLIDIEVARNAYGRQIESFEAELEVNSIGRMQAVFIRAPQVIRLGPEVQVLADYQGQPVVARQGNVLVASFHPELSGETRLHEYFAQMIVERAHS